MSDAYDHSTCVNSWMELTADGLSPEQLLLLFDRALGALWNRAHLALGDVTLMAIMDRVLRDACERFPPFESLKVEAGGFDSREFSKAQLVNDGELREGVRFLLLEFLSVIGNLTGDLLTPALHSELSKITRKDPAQSGKLAQGKY